MDGNWASSPQGETLWDNEDIRWLPDLPAEIIDDITDIQWLKRGHDSPQGQWSVFATTDVEHPAVANPGDGYWDVTYRVLYGIMSFYQAATKDKFVAGIADVKWERGYDDQQFFYTDEDYTGPRVFPELNSPTPTQTEEDNFNKVKMVVTLKQMVPDGFVAKLAAKVFDPDHAHTPIHANDTLDPNDQFVLGPLTPTPIPNDNRQTSGTQLEDGTYGFGARVGAVLAQPSFVINPASIDKTIVMTIQDIQPANNFRAVAVADRHDISRVKFDTDGVNFKFKWKGNTETPVPPQSTTDILTVWRTLWIESDSWKAPTPPVPPAPSVDGPFDGEPGANDDPNPGDLPNAPLDLLHLAYYPGNIVVKEIAESIDTRDNRIFKHNLEAANMIAVTNQVKLLTRDVLPKTSFWVINMIGAYEGPEVQDYDDNEEPFFLGGASITGTNVCYVFLETLRDRAVYPGSSGDNRASVDEDTLKKRVTLHESGHAMGLHHTGGVMIAETNLFGTFTQNMFWEQQLGRIQGQTIPNTTPEPPAP